MAANPRGIGDASLVLRGEGEYDHAVHVSVCSVKYVCDCVCVCVCMFMSVCARRCRCVSVQVVSVVSEACLVLLGAGEYDHISHIRII